MHCEHYTRITYEPSLYPFFPINVFLPAVHPTAGFSQSEWRSAGAEIGSFGGPIGLSGGPEFI
jgi:hypothetical protein